MIISRNNRRRETAPGAHDISTNELAPYWRAARVPPTVQERIIAELILVRRLRNPIRTDEIANKTGLPEREIRAVVERLRAVFRMPVGGSKRRPAGFFWIRTKAEARVAYQCYTCGARTTFKIVRRFIPDDFIAELEGQLRLPAR